MNTKILLIAYSFPPLIGGVEKVLYEISLRFRDNIIVATPVWMAEEEAVFDSRQSFKIIRLGNVKYTLLQKAICKVFSLLGTRNVGHHLVALLKYGLRIYRISKEGDAQFIFCGWITMGLPSYLISKLAGKRFITFAYGKDVLESRGNLINKFIFGRSALIFVLSEFTKRKLLEIGVRQENVVKIHPGAKPVNKSRTVQKSGYQHTKLSFLTICRLEDYKGVDTVLKVIKKIIYYDKVNLKYEVVGDGPDRERLIKLTKNLGLSQYVTFHGFVSEEKKQQLLSNCDIFILVSRFKKETNNIEGFGLVYLEAASCGKPVIGGFLGGEPDAICNKKNGFLVDTTDVEAVYEALLRLCQDKSLRERMGEYGRKWVYEKMNWENTCFEIESAIKNRK